MKRNIIIGIVAFLVCGAVIGNCMDDCSARKESKAQEKFYAMIDEGKLDEARDMVRDMEGSGKYKCAEMLIEECIAQGDVERAINVYERLTPRHCSTYEMQYDGLYGHDGYERRVTKLLYDALIAHDDFDKAWDYHALDYEEPDYPGNAQQVPRRHGLDGQAELRHGLLHPGHPVVQRQHTGQGHKDPLPGLRERAHALHQLPVAGGRGGGSVHGILHL